MTSKTFTVSGMTCSHCVASVSEELNLLPGVESVEIDLGSGRVVVSSTQDITDEAVMALR